MKDGCVIKIRKYESKNPGETSALKEIWNEVVEDGNAFPQTAPLKSDEEAESFFSSQTYTALAEYQGKIAGLYILHPNNIGRCSSIANASYAVSSKLRGKGIGTLLVKDCLEKGKEFGFHVLQFNAVVASNYGALHLYKKLGFVELGSIPRSYLNKEGKYEDLVLFYHEL